MGVGNNDYEDGRLYASGNDAADMSDGEEQDGDLEINHDQQDISASSTASVSIEYDASMSALVVCRRLNNAPLLTDWQRP